MQISYLALMKTLDKQNGFGPTKLKSSLCCKFLNVESRLNSLLQITRSNYVYIIVHTPQIGTSTNLIRNWLDEAALSL